MTDSTFQTPTPITLRVKAASGDLLVTTMEGTESRVSIRPDRDDDDAWAYVNQCTVDLRGDELVVEAPDRGFGLRRRAPGLHIEALVPTDSSLRITVASADVRATGRYGRIDVASASGDIELEDATGELAVKTASGDLKAGDVGGTAKINAASGDITLGRCTGDVTVNAASGDVTVAEALGSVTARTASGDVLVRRAHAGELKVNTASGDVQVGVATGIGVYLDLTSVSGDTTSNLDMAGDQPAGSTDLTLTVRTLSGDIRVDRSH